MSVALLPLCLICLSWMSWLAWSAIADRPAAPPMSVPSLSLYDRVKPVTVEILVNDHLNGSGWIADREGHVITAAHVVIGDDRRIEVLTQTYGRLEAKLIALDRGHDLALLQLPPREEGYAFAPMAAKMPLALSSVYLMGAPIYRHGVLLEGRVARNGTTFEYLPDQRTYIETIHVAGASPRGTSGGPWFNDHGEIIGLQSGMMREQNAAVGIAFVIPVEFIQFLLNTKATVETVTFGAAVEELWEQPWEFLKKFPQKTEGLVVRVPEADGPAAKAGIKEQDVIVAVNDKPIQLRDDFIRLLRSNRAGDEMKLSILRPGESKPLVVAVKLKAMDSN